MASSNEEEFDAVQIVSGLRATFRSGRTRPLEWRVQQLQAIMKMVQENEDAVMDALRSDLRKSRHEAFITEVFCLLLLLPHFLPHQLFVRAWSFWHAE